MSDRFQYALVHDGQIVPGPNAPIVQANAHKPPDHYSAAHGPGCTWFPIVNVDSKPFDPQQHYRLKPTYRVAGDRVERVYQIIKQSEGV